MLPSTPTKCSKPLEKSSYMKVKLFFISALVALFVTAACTDAAKPPILAENPGPTTTVVKDGTQDESHDAPRISLADAKKAYDAGNVVFVDVRDAMAYKQEHIKGALHIPISEAEANQDKLPKNKKIIVYCS
ncbi:MAG: hypothetical protein DMF63_18200 [Acidobacteria bacterium]|nr:MAG: hypothetical protein DMF63_18200 [Acidobacteriota bacterium]